MTTVGLKFLTVGELERVQSVPKGFEAPRSSRQGRRKAMEGSDPGPPRERPRG